MSHASTAVAERWPTLEPDATAAIADPLAALVEAQLRLLGEDPLRPGLERTPQRVSSALAALTAGYAQDPRGVIGDGVFEHDGDESVLVQDVEFYSLCEHHLLPFFGKVHVAYIPDGRILGLSKVPRIIDVFARRLQVQERLTAEIADAVMGVVGPRGVGVVVEAQHLCMMMRGVEKQGSSTVTMAMRGVFRSCPTTRAEFLRQVQRTS